jgi:hypothetical protein
MEIENILTKTVQLHRRDWVSRFPKAIWAYRTTWNKIIGFTPYELVYGKTIVPLFFFLKPNWSPKKPMELPLSILGNMKGLTNEQLKAVMLSSYTLGSTYLGRVIPQCILNTSALYIRIHFY